MYTFKEKQNLCAIRRTILKDKATPSELDFKNKLEAAGINYIFQKGFIQGNNFCIVDFYLPKPYKICIEIDGEYHNTPEQVHKDKYRTQYLQERGFKILRFTNKEVNSLDSKAIINKIYSLI